MADDPYQVLGVSRDADAEAIRRAYRALARQHHPDLNPGDAGAEERFKRVNAANDLLSDPERRARFDRGEIDASGAEQVPPGARARWRDFAEGAAGARYDRAGGGAASGNPAGGWRTEDLGDIFGSMFGEAGADPAAPRRGRDERYTLAVDFLDAVRGATRTLTLPDGRVLDVRIPPGLENGQTLRLRERGAPGRNGGPAGDALIEVTVGAHPFYRREGDDLRLELPVTLKEAVLGGRVDAPTPTGTVALAVPARSDSGRVLRLRGRGVPTHAGRPAGDLLVTLRVTLAGADDALGRLLEGWEPANVPDPRRGMTGGGGA